MAVRLTQKERRERTREQLIGTGDRLFTAHGFHATSMDQIAAEAGYTKGAIYSNFESKEDLFFAVYEQRTARRLQELERTFEELAPIDAVERILTAGMERRRQDDGWIAVFFEFWAHVLRNPELRERFAVTHAAMIEPVIPAVERTVAERGLKPAVKLRRFTAAMYAMQLGLQLERLTQPDVVDEELSVAMSRLVLNSLDGGTAG